MPSAGATRPALSTTPILANDRANAAAGVLLSCVCRGRSLINFFAKNRVDVLKAMAAARAGQIVQGSGVIRRLERRTREVAFSVGPDPEQDTSLKWVFDVRLC